MNAGLSTIVFIYLIVCLLLSLIKSSKITSITNYALGSKSFSIEMMVATIFATGVSAAAIFSITESIYKKGFYIIIIAMLRPCYWLITGYILSRNIEKMAGCLSIADVIQKIYGGIKGSIVTIAGVIISIGMLAVQFTAIVAIFSFIEPGKQLLPMAVLATIVLYSSLGGRGAVEAVVKTDLVQFLIFYIVFPLLCVYGFQKAGGLRAVGASLGMEYFRLNLTRAREAGWEDFITLVIFTLIPEIDPPHIQRVLMQGTGKGTQNI